TKPKNLDQMLEIASKLAMNFEFISVDLYTNGSSIFVGELTNCPGDGQGIFLPNGSEEEVSKIIFSIE
ncbi:MAG: ATP-grasp fold amidoligase family protein, partial [Thermodesulfobacteriota bacterium]